MVSIPVSEFGNVLAGPQVVEACSWDLTMGAAKNMIGKLFLRTTSTSSHDTPEAIDHVGIIAFNRLYEFGHSGIKKSNIPRNGDDPEPQYPGCKLRRREYLGRTQKSKEEFFEWIVNVKYGEYRGSHYDMIHHNCLDFARAVCHFLEVPPNPNWEKISNWAKNNQKFAGLFTRSAAGTCISGGGSVGNANGENGPSTSSDARRSRSLLRSMTIPEESTNSDAESETAPEYSSVVANSPRRRRFSLNRSFSGSGRCQSRFSFRSRSASLASMETLPPTYEEALKMSSMPRRDSIQSTISAAPSYESSMRAKNNKNNNNATAAN